MSSQIVDEGVYAHWLVNGNCLQEVTNVALANDSANNYEELPVEHVDTDGHDSLEIPLVTRRGL